MLTQGDLKWLQPPVKQCLGDMHASGKFLRCGFLEKQWLWCGPRPDLNLHQQQLLSTLVVCASPASTEPQPASSCIKLLSSRLVGQTAWMHEFAAISCSPLVHGDTLILVATCMLVEYNLQLFDAGLLRQPPRVLKLRGKGGA